MSGLFAAALALQINPLLKGLYRSGCTDRHILQEGALKPRADVLEKPFVPNVFLRKVREVPDRKRVPQSRA
ncbi:MAG: hypothetical protein JO332_11930 [Planctomycetaceae bacterium]|nr:hypothetical protein [Planctomycetaceae bacterium]